jgi:hypothetical protein
MATRKTLDRGTTGWEQRISSGPARLRILLALSAAAAAVAALIAYSGSPAAAAAGTAQDGVTQAGHLPAGRAGQADRGPGPRRLG